jgi:drug/metabolite transporter (DMT)-like permease
MPIFPKPSRRLGALLQAVFITILWASSWVLIKFGLRAELPALTFAGARYLLAFACLLPFALLPGENRAALRALTARQWGGLAALGIILYTVAQGAQFVSLAHLPAATLSLVLNLTPLVVAASGIFFLKEIPTSGQWLGIGVTMLGVGIYFFERGLSPLSLTGVFAASLSLAGNTAGTVMGRHINRAGFLPPVLVTFVSMGIGSALMLALGVATQGWGKWDATALIILAWMAVINTAFAFTLWNLTLQTLSAVESSIINSLMMPQIAILAFVFLGETLVQTEIIGLVLVGAGVLVVQLMTQNRLK